MNDSAVVATALCRRLFREHLGLLLSRPPRPAFAGSGAAGTAKAATVVLIGGNCCAVPVWDWASPSRFCER